MSGDPTFVELLARVREADLAAFDHRDVPFDRVVEALAPTRSSAHHPLFQVMLVLQNNAGAVPDLPGLDVAMELRSMGTSKFDLTLDLGERVDVDGGPGGIRGTLEYAVDLFDRDTAEALVARLERVLTAVAAEPRVRAGRIDVLSAQERQRVLVDFGGAGTELVADRTLHRVFEECAASVPDAVALVFGGDRVSYGELNARANRLARYLVGEGVLPGRLVGVYLPRGPEMVVAL
ncbi:condensation domain-containing protein, partial [Nocardiopsis sp. MG754419]|uniref:condensation domain-containing protein n=1 Tax=Nocardiopsis sp. MG754419 TaxID=2259865 RepID=UPI0027DCA639